MVFFYNKIYLNDKIFSSVKDIFRIGKSGVLLIVKKIDNFCVEFFMFEFFVFFFRYVGGLNILFVYVLKELVSIINLEGELNYLIKWGIDILVIEIVGNGMYCFKSYVLN